MSIHIDGELEIEVRDRKGRIKKQYKQPMRSFVKNFLKILRAGFRDQDEPDVIDQSGDAYTVGNPSDSSGYYLYVEVDAGDYGAGVLIGSGTTPPSNDDYKLESKYDTSVFNYGSVSVSSVVEEEGYVKIKIARQFTNISGSEKTINEVGLAAYTQSSGGYTKFLIARDVLDQPITLADGEIIIIRYVIKIMA